MKQKEISSFIPYKYIDPDEKNKYRDRTMTLKRILPDPKNYNSSFKTISRDQRIYYDDLVSKLLVYSNTIEDESSHSWSWKV
jgi:hypothetical protein